VAQEREQSKSLKDLVVGELIPWSRRRLCLNSAFC
jgi:hypothetical protein